MKERVIFHCDANSFYASCEVAQHPELKGLAVAVAGNPEKRTGIILTKNEVAKKYGVATGDVIWQAKLKCPNLVCLSPHFSLYEDFSKRLREIYERYTDRVESFGIDECWLDVTDTLKFFGDKKALADRIRDDVRSEIGITISVGVSFCKLFAKLGSDLKKPDATTIISMDNYKSIVYPLPITAVIGVGKRLERRYNQIGVTVLGDLVQIPDNVLKKKFGILGLQLKQTLLGFDDDEVKKCDLFIPPKSVGNGTTTATDIYTKSQINGVVSMLAQQISSRLRAGNFAASGLSVTIKTGDFRYFHETTRMPFASNTSGDISKFAMELISSFWHYNEPVRAIRICTYNLSTSKQIQLCMFSNQDLKLSTNTAIDKIRKKYGYSAILTANAINDINLCSNFLR